MSGRGTRPHLIGIDDGPFRKGVDSDTPLVAVFMEGPDLVEGVATTRFGVDGDGVTSFLADWIGALRFQPAAQGLLLGGITTAGLALIDAPALAEATGLPVLVVNRRAPDDANLERALRSAGLEARLELLSRAPAVHRIDPPGVWVGCAGASPEAAAALVRGTIRKGALPEPLRLAHLIAAAVARGSSRGRA